MNPFKIALTLFAPLTLASLLIAQPPASTDRDLFKEKLRELHKFAADGDFDASAELRRLRLEGQGTKDDYVNVYELARLAEERGDPDILFSLASAHFYGKGGFETDHEKARKLYERSAAVGHRKAVFNLGVMQQRGEGGAKDLDGAFDSFEKAHRQGHPQALEEMGVVRVHQNRFEEAVAYMEASPLDAGQGAFFGRAKAYLGLKRTPENRAKALECLKAGSDQGKLEASILMAVVLLDDRYGVQPDPEQALQYVDLVLSNRSKPRWSWEVFCKHFVDSQPEALPENAGGSSKGRGKAVSQEARNRVDALRLPANSRLKEGLLSAIERSRDGKRVERLIDEINRRSLSDSQAAEPSPSRRASTSQ